jgi:hypothetical protein
VAINRVCAGVIQSIQLSILVSSWVISYHSMIFSYWIPSTLLFLNRQSRIARRQTSKCRT